MTQENTLTIEGMTCASCVTRVEKALAKVPGVVSAEVNLPTETARVRGGGDAAALIAAVQRAGYAAHVHAEGEAAGAAPLWPVLLAAALSLPLVLPMVAELFGRHWMLPGWLQLALATPPGFSDITRTPAVATRIATTMPGDSASPRKMSPKTATCTGSVLI